MHAPAAAEIPPMSEFDLGEVGQRIYTQRVQQRLSQGDLADAVGVGQTTISALERGKIKTPPIDLLYALAAALHVGRPYLMLLSDDPAPQTSPMADEERNILVLLRSLDEADRALVTRLVQALSRRRRNNR